jgi:hypothetical protein
VGTYVFELNVTDASGRTSVTRRVEVSAKAATVAPAPTDSTKTTPVLMEIDTIEGDTGEAKKGNVEYNWKVEEGEKGAVEGVGDVKANTAQPITPDFSILLGGGGSTDDAEFKGGVSVAAGDVNGLTEEEKEIFLQAVKMHAQVTSGKGLENFAHGVLVQNASMEEIALNFEKIKMSHRAQAKLLGFIPISIKEQVEVESEGETLGKVRVKMPWFNFLVKKTVTAPELELAISNEIKASLGDNENWDFGDRALVLVTVSNVLKTKHDTAKNSVSNVR